VKKLAAGVKATMILTDLPESQLKKTTHEVSPTKREEGIMHVYYDKQGKLVKVPQSEFQEKKSTLPDCCFAFKYPIEDANLVNLPDLSYI
jgi:hypothetical protein